MALTLCVALLCVLRIMKPNRLLAALVFLFLLASASHARGWRGIVPLQSNSEEVKRILGVSECETDNCKFKDEHESASIRLAEKACDYSELDPDFSWNVPAGTVLNISVFPQKTLALSDLAIDLSTFKTRPIKRQAGWMEYVNEDQGSIITVDNHSDIVAFYYGPAAENEPLRCKTRPKPKPTPASAIDVPTGNSQIDLALRKLQSGDEAERTSGKRELLKSGPSAIPPLLAILKEIAAGEHTWFRIPDDDEAAKKAEAESRLWAGIRNDVYELLGRLHSEEAVPFLIKLMEERDLDNLMEKWRPDMTALADIGLGAVPKLIECIENAEATATRNERLHPVGAVRIQIRASMVLGKIGDGRALPTLERLYAETKFYEFKYAIDQIMKTKRIESEP